MSLDSCNDRFFFPNITTIITTYRRPYFLKKAIQSVLNQSFTKIRIIVYDDASDEETKNLVEEQITRDSRIHYYSQTIRLGSLRNFQFGLDQVQTPFCSILADDDLLLPHFYEQGLKALQEAPEAQFFWGGVLEVDEKGKAISHNAQYWPKEGLYQPPEGLYAMINHYVNWTGVLFRTSVAQSIRIDPNVEALDLDFMARLTAIHPFIFSKTPCALFTQHTRSYSNSCGVKLFYPGWLYTTETLMNYSFESSFIKSEIKRLMNQVLKKGLFRLAVRCLMRKQFVEVEKALALKEMRDLGITYWFLRWGFFLCKSNRVLFNAAKKIYQILLVWKRRSLQKLAQRCFKQLGIESGC